MILEKIEKNGLIEVLYESSNIVASKYNKSDKSLSIIFKHGGNYVYSNVPETDYFRFETAESQGKVLNSNIKKYAFIKEENVDVSEVIDRIKNIKQEEVMIFERGLIDCMKKVTKHYDDIGRLIGIDKLNNMLLKYESIK